MILCRARQTQQDQSTLWSTEQYRFQIVQNGDLENCSLHLCSCREILRSAASRNYIEGLEVHFEGLEVHFDAKIKYRLAMAY